MADTEPTHDRLAKLLDLTIASVSRIRTGKRHPSMNAMLRIQSLFSWSVGEQVAARSAHRYAREFNAQAELWARSNPLSPTPTPEPATNGS